MLYYNETLHFRPANSAILINKHGIHPGSPPTTMMHLLWQLDGQTIWANGRKIRSYLSTKSSRHWVKARLSSNVHLLTRNLHMNHTRKHLYTLSSDRGNDGLPQWRSLMLVMSVLPAKWAHVAMLYISHMFQLTKLHSPHTIASRPHRAHIRKDPRSFAKWQAYHHYSPSLCIVLVVMVTFFG